MSVERDKAPFRDATRARKDTPLSLDDIAAELRRQSALLDGEGGRRDKRSAVGGKVAQEANEYGRISGGRGTSKGSEHDGNGNGNGNEETASLMDGAFENGGSGPGSSRVPRKSSDVLTDRLLQARQRAEDAERRQRMTSEENRQLREQVRALQQRIDQRISDIQDKVSANGSAGNGDEAEALRRELDLVRARAAQDLNALREQLHAGTASASEARDVELEAELQAARQEVAILRHSVKEKDKVLEDLAGQCRGLEDMLEDRDREMERLHRELNQVSMDSAPSDSGALGGGRETDPLYAFQEKETSEVLDGTSLIYVPSESRPPWATYAIVGIGGLLAGALLLGALLWIGNGGWGDGRVAEPAPTAPAATTLVAVAEPSAQAAEALPPAPERTTEAPAEPAVDAAPPAPRFKAYRDRLRDGSSGPFMVELPGGAFTMGGKPGPDTLDEQPTREVSVAPFSIGRYEVSFDEYDRFARATGRSLPDDGGWGRGARPVINVSWDDARAYARWLSGQTGANYRLPSEAEWEYAARGGTSARYWWGYAGDNGRAVCFDCGSSWDNLSTAPVGSLEPNPFTLYDTAGNAMEWVEDCSNRDYRGAPVDGGPWLSGDCGQRMVRGGAFSKPLSTLRSAARSRLPKQSRFNMLGFRLARD